MQNVAAHMRRFARRVAGPFAVALCLLAATSSAAQQPMARKDTTVWVVGNYSFSDEMGGFSIRGVSGAGTRENPVIIDQDLRSVGPVTLVIRENGAAQFDPNAGNLMSGALHMRINITNASGRAWIEFEFELQEILGRASTFSDGLSFDQRRDNTDLIRSTGFETFRRDFEPYDKLRFFGGKMDPGETAEFGFALTDFTPRWTFYLIEDPRIPSS